MFTWLTFEREKGRMLILQLLSISVFTLSVYFMPLSSFERRLFQCPTRTWIRYTDAFGKMSLRQQCIGEKVQWQSFCSWWVQFQFVSNPITITPNSMISPLTALAYADDVCPVAFYGRLLWPMPPLDRYGSVSNAKVNIHKTEAFSLDGCSCPGWIAFLAA
jgi:hypothetical protein